MLYASDNEAHAGYERDLLVIGKIAGPYGVRGWSHVHSYTDPKTNILEYTPWFVGKDELWQQYKIAEGRSHGKGIVVRFPSCTDRDHVEILKGALIAVKKTQLPPPDAGEYYWFDLVGLQAVTLEGHILGRVDSIMATGANDVLVIKGEREYLVPYVKNEFVKEVNLEKAVIIVNWDPDFSS